MRLLAKREERLHSSESRRPRDRPALACWSAAADLNPPSLTEVDKGEGGGTEIILLQVELGAPPQETIPILALRCRSGWRQGEGWTAAAASSSCKQRHSRLKRRRRAKSQLDFHDSVSRAFLHSLHHNCRSQLADFVKPPPFLPPFIPRENFADPKGLGPWSCVLFSELESTLSVM